MRCSRRWQPPSLRQPRQRARTRSARTPCAPAWPPVLVLHQQRRQRRAQRPRPLPRRAARSACATLVRLGVWGVKQLLWLGQPLTPAARLPAGSRGTSLSPPVTLVALPAPEFAGTQLTPTIRAQPAFSASTPAAPANTPAMHGGGAGAAQADLASDFAGLSTDAAAMAVAAALSERSSRTPEQSPGAASPAPPTPYAATEFDGDDVIMADAGA